MGIDLKPYFKMYEALVAKTDEVFEKIKTEYPDEVKCEVTCSDCCHALFDLSLIEALYINYHFNKTFEGKSKEILLERANVADRKVHRMKRQAQKEYKTGKSEEQVLTSLASQRVRCPLLNNENLCEMYQVRPITCRLYGIPTVIGGKGHTCGLSGFEEGQSYPTVNLEMIHKRLYEISAEFVASIQTRYGRMSEMLVPLSMALLTDYTDEYLGIVDKENESTEGDK